MDTKLRLSLTLTTALSLVAHTAHAEAPLPSPDDNEAFLATPVPEPAKPTRRVSPGGALGLALLGTGTSWAAWVIGWHSEIQPLAAAGYWGFHILPSAGHMYTGDWWRVGAGIGLRTGGTQLFLNSFARLEGEEAAALGLVGRIMFLGGMAYSIIDAPFSAIRSNEKSRRRVSVSPTALMGPGGSQGWGAAAAFRF